MFTLLDRDPLAPFLVSIWSKIRMGDEEAARAVFESMLTQVAPRYRIEPDVKKGIDAMNIAIVMFRNQAFARAEYASPD